MNALRDRERDLESANRAYQTAVVKEREAHARLTAAVGAQSDAQNAALGILSTSAAQDTPDAATATMKP